jgi:hypothetical protein
MPWHAERTQVLDGTPRASAFTIAERTGGLR